MTAVPPDSAFWQFSLALYGRPGVPDACLRLQDECGVDVNVMLYLLYVASVGRLIDSDDIERIETLAAPWREEIVRPMRDVRRRLKTPPAHFQNAASESLRSALKRIELEAEHLEQLALERDLPAHALGTASSDSSLCAAQNLRMYAQRLGAFPDGPVAVLLRRFNDS